MSYSINGDEKSTNNINLLERMRNVKKFEADAKAYAENTSQLDLERFVHRYNESINPYISKVFIDLPVLFDVYLHAIIMMTSKQEGSYEYILSQLQTYHDRYDDKHAKYFPNFNISEEDLLSYMTNTNILAKLVLVAPPTNYLPVLEEFHYHAVKNNRVACEVRNMDYDPVVRYTLNMYPLHLSETLTTYLQVKLREGLNSTKLLVDCISEPSHNLPVEIYKEYGAYFLYDFSQWTVEGTNAHKALLAHSLQNSSITARPTITNKELYSISENWKLKDFLNYEKYLLTAVNAFTQYRHLKPTILTDN